LALKRELRLTEGRLTSLDQELAQVESETVALTASIGELATKLEARNEERRRAETEAANQGATLKQMEAEALRIKRRLEDWALQAADNKDERDAQQSVIKQKSEEVERLEAVRKTGDAAVEEQQERLASKRQIRDSLQQEAAQMTAELAGLEERRSGAEAAFHRIDRVRIDLERRLLAIEEQRTATETERELRVGEVMELAKQGQLLNTLRADARAQEQAATAQAQELRQELIVLETQLKAGRATLERLREDRANRSREAAKLQADLDHIEASCLAEANIEAQVLRADPEITPIAGEELAEQEENCRVLRQRIEEMSPVNMMAIDEYKETAGRHEFLEAQRKDLIESIASTQEAIKEIDLISHTKFDEALAKINENFAQVFAWLFQGGQALLRVTDAGSQADPGIEIVASPPGKRLQNVLLLSGGEKALTALALLVAIFQFRPSPFCVLDEVDAPLDESNVGRFADLMGVLSKDAQFLVVTHSKRMMQSADMIYGVTMQEPGVSKMVSMRLGGGGRYRASA
jgi:chromosome segregation protein